MFVMICDFVHRRTLKPFGCKVLLVEPSGFRTPLTADFLAALDRAWNQCPQITQLEYTDEYRQSCKQLLHVWCKTNMNIL